MATIRQKLNGKWVDIAIDGKDGLDAYELAVKEGFSGDFRQWLDSFKGEQGLPGKDGSPDTPKEIVDKLNTLEQVIESKVIKDLLTPEDIVKMLKDPKNKLDIEPRNIKGMPLNFNDMRWHGGGGSGGAGATWIPLGPTTSDDVGGILTGTDLGIVAIPIQDTLRDIFYPPTLASIVLVSSEPGGIREIGDIASLTAVDFEATTTEGTNPITLVDFYEGVTLIYSVPVPIPTGGLETDPNPETIITDTSFTAKVGDGILPQVTSNTITYTFVSAYYFGVGAPGLTPTQVSNLTKLVISNTASVTESFTTVAQVSYFAYPDSYPALTSILDINGFEVISDWTVTTGNSITNDFGDTDTYRIYEFLNITTTTMDYTFIE